MCEEIETQNLIIVPNNCIINSKNGDVKTMYPNVPSRQSEKFAFSAISPEENWYEIPIYVLKRCGKLRL